MKKIIIPILALSLVFFYQCKKDELLQPSDSGQSTLKAGKGGGNGGGGNGGGGNGGGGGDGGGNGGSGGLYGDLVICLRTVDGIPIYEEIYSEEHGTTSYYPLPIKVAIADEVPLKTDDQTSYVTFDLNAEGEVIDDDPLYDVKEVEFGRLNIVRAPQTVIDQALGEAISGLTQPGVSFITTDASGRLVAIIGQEDWLVNYDDNPDNDEFDDKTIDSPRENVALYQELMGNRLNGALSFLVGDFSDDDVMMLAVGAIAAGADKTGNMTVDELGYMNNWLIRWSDPYAVQAVNSPDVKERFYYNYSAFSYNRSDEYSDKWVRITHLNEGGTWEYEYLPLFDAVTWTNPNKLVKYSVGSYDITGFADAADDAVQVIEFIHSSDMIEYSPLFKP